MKKEEVVKFIQARMEDPDFDGCYYMELGNDLYLVFTKNEFDDLDCKVAYNCDDLQCDYDLDWELPTTKCGEICIGQDWEDVIKCFNKNAFDLADEVIDSYNYVIGCGWTKSWTKPE